MSDYSFWLGVMVGVLMPKLIDLAILYFIVSKIVKWRKRKRDYKLERSRVNKYIRRLADEYETS